MSIDIKIVDDGMGVISTGYGILNGDDIFAIGKKAFRSEESIRKINTAVDVLGFTQARCGEYSKLKSSLLRSAGVPTRFIYGTSPYDFGPVHLNKKNTINDHLWVEVYLPKQGWVIVPSTAKFFEPMQFREVYHIDYYIRRRGLDTDYDHLRKTKGLKKFSNSHGNGVFLNIESVHFKKFSEVLKEVLTYNKPVNPNVFEKIKVLPKKAQVIVYWFLTGNKEPFLHSVAAKKFVEVIKEVPVFKLKNFIYVSSEVMKRRIQSYL